MTLEALAAPGGRRRPTSWDSRRRPRNEHVNMLPGRKVHRHSPHRLGSSYWVEHEAVTASGDKTHAVPPAAQVLGKPRSRATQSGEGCKGKGEQAEKSPDSSCTCDHPTPAGRCTLETCVINLTSQRGPKGWRVCSVLCVTRRGGARGANDELWSWRRPRKVPLGQSSSTLPHIRPVRRS